MYFGLACLEEEELERTRPAKLERRVLRDVFDPFTMDDVLFKKNFRLDKRAFEYVLSELEDELASVTLANSLEPIHRLSCILRFLAEGGYQQGTGNDYNVGMAQSTVSKVISSCLTILEKNLCPKWINLEMSPEEKRLSKIYFYSRSRFPSVIMCVDGTHVKLIKPIEESHIYYNRKGFYSINALLVCDNKERIRFVDSRYPGCNHDAHIWKLSSCRDYFEQKYKDGERNSYLLGDAGFALEPWLMTPFRSPAEGSAEHLYNKRHIKARKIIERVIGILKNRFRCLLDNKLHYAPKKTSQIINVACALHNICINYKVRDDSLSEMLNEEDVNEDYTDTSSVLNTVAIEIRNNILASFV